MEAYIYFLFHLWMRHFHRVDSEFAKSREDVARAGHLQSISPLRGTAFQSLGPPARLTHCHAVTKCLSDTKGRSAAGALQCCKCGYRPEPHQPVMASPSLRLSEIRVISNRTDPGHTTGRGGDSDGHLKPTVTVTVQPGHQSC